jgi:hypothetical protein
MEFAQCLARCVTRICVSRRNITAIRQRGRRQALDVDWLIESEQLIQVAAKKIPGFPRLFNSFMQPLGQVPSSSPFGRHGLMRPR